MKKLLILCICGLMIITCACGKKDDGDNKIDDVGKENLKDTIDDWNEILGSSTEDDKNPETQTGDSTDMTTNITTGTTTDTTTDITTDTTTDNGGNRGDTGSGDTGDTTETGDTTKTDDTTETDDKEEDSESWTKDY